MHIEKGYRRVRMSRVITANDNALKTIGIQSWAFEELETFAPLG